MAWSPRYTEPEVREAVAASMSLSQALRRLGLRPAGGNHTTLKRLIERWEIPTSHFDPSWARRGPRDGRMRLEDILVENSTYSRGHLKRRLFQAGLKTRRCELCGQGEAWRGRRMGLILDHTTATGPTTAWRT